MNEFLVNVLNEFLREEPHLIPAFRKDGDRSSSSTLLYEVEIGLKVARK